MNDHRQIRLVPRPERLPRQKIEPRKPARRRDPFAVPPEAWLIGAILVAGWVGFYFAWESL